MTVLQILSAIKNNGHSIEYSELLNSGNSDPNRDPTADNLRLQALKADRYIKGRLEPFHYISLTSKGIKRLDELYKEADKESKQERQQRFDNKVSVASVLVPLITFVLGLLVEHYTDLVSLLISFFK